MRRRPDRSKRTSLSRGVTLGVAVALMTATMPAGLAAAAPVRDGCESRDNDTAAKLLECVTLNGVQRHLNKFAAIAKANQDPVFPGSRAPGTQGYEDSVRYVAGELRRAGYEVTLDSFEVVTTSAQLRQLTPEETDHPTIAFTGSGLGSITGTVIPAGLNLDSPEDSTSACTATDFDELDFSGETDIALIQRGGCDYSEKVVNAQTAGAEAVVIFNQGPPDRLGLEPGGLYTDDGQTVIADIPVVAATHGDGVALSAPGVTATVNVTQETRSDVSVIADLPGKNRENVVVAGAHLDSVGTSPGINDNGSGAAALLETALQMANHHPQNTLRFAWWGAEEEGMWGSGEYLRNLTQEEFDRIALYLNYDMVASPNYMFMVLDSDGSTFPPPEGLALPPGGTAIEQVYEDYYTQVGEPFTATPIEGRSDDIFFVLSGIPSGGLFTGAEGIKTREEQKIWGGTAGQPYDPCYHAPCDNLANINRHALDVNSDAMAYAQLTFAYSTEAVNGVPGAEMPGDGKLPRPDNKPWLKWSDLPTAKWHPSKWDHRNRHHEKWHRLHQRHKEFHRKLEATFGRLRIPGKVTDQPRGQHRAPRDAA